jgi:hypothetical protein
MITKLWKSIAFPGMQRLQSSKLVIDMFNITSPHIPESGAPGSRRRSETPSRQVDIAHVLLFQNICLMLLAITLDQK